MAPAIARILVDGGIPATSRWAVLPGKVPALPCSPRTLMFPLSHMLKSFVRTGTLTVIDAEEKSIPLAGPRAPRSQCA